LHLLGYVGLGKSHLYRSTNIEAEVAIARRHLKEVLCPRWARVAQNIR